MTPTTAAQFITDLVTRRSSATHTDLALPFAIWTRLLDTILREPVTLTFTTWTGDEPNVCFWLAHRRSYLKTSVRGATTFLSADWAKPQFLVVIPKPIVFGVFFHHLVVIVVHHWAILPTDQFTGLGVVFIDAL